MIPDRVQKVAWLVASVGVVALALAVSLDKPWVAPRPPSDAGASASDAGSDARSAEGGSETTAPAQESDASLAALPTPASPMDLLVVSDSSTRHVRMGVVLVQFAGAQGAPPTARPKTAALELARKLSDEAKTDFHQAVTHGDPGSADDIGRIARGILEPPVEGLVFSMAAGQISEPVETPRGYWVVKRLE